MHPNALIHITFPVVSPSQPKTAEALDEGMGHLGPGMGEAGGEEGTPSFCSCSWQAQRLRAVGGSLCRVGPGSGQPQGPGAAARPTAVKATQPLYLWVFSKAVFSLHFCPPRNIRQQLELFWVVTTGKWVLLASSR